MVYLVMVGEASQRVMLVKGENEDIVKERLRLKDGEVIVGRLTDN